MFNIDWDLLGVCSITLFTSRRKDLFCNKYQSKGFEENEKNNVILGLKSTFSLKNICEMWFWRCFVFYFPALCFSCEIIWKNLSFLPLWDPQSPRRDQRWQVSLFGSHPLQNDVYKHLFLFLNYSWMSRCQVTGQVIIVCVCPWS